MDPSCDPSGSGELRGGPPGLPPLPPNPRPPRGVPLPRLPLPSPGASGFPSGPPPASLNSPGVLLVRFSP